MEILLKTQKPGASAGLGWKGSGIRRATEAARPWPSLSRRGESGAFLGIQRDCGEFVGRLGVVGEKGGQVSDISDVRRRGLLSIGVAVDAGVVRAEDFGKPTRVGEHALGFP